MPKRVFRWNANGEGAQCIKQLLEKGHIDDDTDYMKVYSEYGHLWQGMKADNFRWHYQKLVAHHFNKQAVKEVINLFIYTFNIKPIS